MIKSALKFVILGLVFLASPAFADEVVAQKEWTMLVFLNGHNNLDSYGKMNVKQMEEIGSTDQINVVVQWATMSANTKRYFITKSSSVNQVTSPVVQDMGQKIDMGSAEELYKFIKWGMENYPAKKYFVDVWNHGNGWHRSKISEDFGRDISFDDISGNNIKTEELGRVLKQIAQETGGPIELYGSDACLMSMVEVAGEMAGGVNYFVGSQDLEPGEGWPYNTFLKQWTSNPTVNGAGLAKILVQEFEKAYSDDGIYGQQDVTFSAFDMSQYQGIVNVTRSLTEKLKALNPAQLKLLKSKLYTVQNFYSDDYRDMKDFVLKLPSMGVSITSDFETQFNTAFNAFVISETADEHAYFGAYGLSFWLPTTKSSYSDYSARYNNLQFSKESGWGDVLQMIFK